MERAEEFRPLLCRTDLQKMSKSLTKFDFLFIMNVLEAFYANKSRFHIKKDGRTRKRKLQNRCIKDCWNMYRKEADGWLKHLDFIVLDMVCLQIAFILAYLLRWGKLDLYQVDIYRHIAVIIEFADLFGVMFFETLHGVLKRGYYEEFLATAKQDIIIGVTTVAFCFLAKENQRFSRICMGLTMLFYLMICYPARILLKQALRKRMSVGGNRSLLVITTRGIAQSVMENLKQNNYEMYKFTGIVITDDDMVGTKILDVPVVATAKTVVDYVCEKWISEAIIVRNPDEPYPAELVEELIHAGVTVHLSLTRIKKIVGKKQMVEKIGGYTVLTSSLNFASPKQLFVKRLMDIAGGLVGCLMTAVVFVFVAPLIYIQSPGPIFFAQERVGRNGKRFKMYKFRSMYLDAEERKAALMRENKMSDGKMFKLDFDPRVIGNKILPDGTKKTGIGDFIRRTSLDELPQFFNVLKGDMSLVGTRPPLIDEVAQYELHHRARLAIKPGITGLWQVSGRSNITDFEEVVALDTQYISEWNIGLDIRILLKTVMVVLKEDGSM